MIKRTHYVDVGPLQEFQVGTSKLTVLIHPFPVSLEVCRTGESFDDVDVKYQHFIYLMSSPKGNPSSVSHKVAKAASG